MKEEMQKNNGKLEAAWEKLKEKFHFPNPPEFPQVEPPPPLGDPRTGAFPNDLWGKGTKKTFDTSSSVRVSTQSSNQKPKSSKQAKPLLLPPPKTFPKHKAVAITKQKPKEHQHQIVTRSASAQTQRSLRKRW